MTFHHCFAEVCFLDFLSEVIYIALIQLKEGILKFYWMYEAYGKK